MPDKIIMNTQSINEIIYRETIEDLRAEIESKYEAISYFCEEHNIDKFNLYRIFSSNKSNEMSVGLFAGIMTALGVEGLENVTSSSLSLRQYLEIDNNAIFKSILAIKFS